MTDIVWVVPEKKGGIASYSKELWPEIQKAAKAEGLSTADPITDLTPSIEDLKKLNPRVIHVQHEFGLFGSKVPMVYFFPTWLKRVREEMPQAKVVATGHTILHEDFRLPLKGRGWQIPLRFLANQFAMSALRKLWINETWGVLDGVLVHSELQRKTVENSGCPFVEVIPHFVHRPDHSARTYQPIFRSLPKDTPIVVVFGFFTPEKGQDIAIQAFAGLKMPAFLVLGGGARRKEDQPYFKKCKRMIKDLDLGDRSLITGYLSEAQMEELFARATVVVAPFHETSGSGSLAQALGRGCAILASDLPLNREITEREPGALAFFKSGNASDCANALERLMENAGERGKLSLAAKRYADTYSPTAVAKLHLEFYSSFLKKA